MNPFKEEILHYIWKFRLFQSSHLLTVEGFPIEILSVGDHNKNAGPDFLSSRLKINNILWVGNVEIHINGFEWKHHKHDEDPAYDNVILHVVFDNPYSPQRKDGSFIPVFSLSRYIEKDFFTNYDRLNEPFQFIPCENSIVDLHPFFVENWVYRLSIERLAQKAEHIHKNLIINKNNWESCFYQCIASNFGFKINSVPFEWLAHSLPQELLAKHKNNAFQLEALLFGQSGLLEGDFHEEYPLQLKKEFGFLRKKYRLNPLSTHSWKFLRMRPKNFPTLRIAQFSALISNSNNLFDQLIHTRKLEEIYPFFFHPTNPYWKTHIVFNKISANEFTEMGRESVDNIIINTLAPFLFLYGKLKSNDKYLQRAIEFLEKIKHEENSKITNFKNLGLKFKNSFESQGLLQLKNFYCDQKKCLTCGIGLKLLQTQKNE